MTGTTLILLVCYLPVFMLGAMWGHRMTKRMGHPQSFEGPVVPGQWFWVARVGEFRVDTVSREVEGVYHRTGMKVSIPHAQFRQVATPCEAPPEPPLPHSAWTLPDLGTVYVVKVTDARAVRLSSSKPTRDRYGPGWVVAEPTFEVSMGHFYDNATPVAPTPAIEQKA